MSTIEEALQAQFPLLKDIPHENPKDIPPLTNFVQAMAIPVLRDYTQPPPPVPGDAATTTPTARVQMRHEQIDRHAAAVSRNFHFMAQREARRIADLCRQDEDDMRELNELDRLPVYGLGGGEDPATTLDLDVLLGQEPDGPPERYALRQGLSQHEFEVPEVSVLSDMPRKVLQIKTLSLIQTAMNNMKGRAGAAGQQKEAARAEVAMEMARRFSEPQRDSESTAPAAGVARGPGEAMDTSAG
ncbi:hypothetical protein MN608_09691 [Microdochium nivale]|nr:hypothetical protein MN608_09691 [Microdochium nivale]